MTDSISIHLPGPEMVWLKQYGGGGQGRGVDGWFRLHSLTNIKMTPTC